MQNIRFTFVDLFAGIGGFKMALSNNGGHCLGFSEINQDAINTYCENFQIDPSSNLGDITKIKELPPHDLLTAGVPCQSWSIAGKNLGFDDDRGQLWNDTIYLLQQSKPKAFIFENVKGLVDPRNKKALSYILERIEQAGYHANYFVINSFDYGVPQNRIRIYIIGFQEKEYFQKFNLPKPTDKKLKLSDILGILPQQKIDNKIVERDIFGNIVESKSMSLSSTNGFNDYFLFNDLRNGHTTIHSWDIIETTQRQKDICLLLLKNRRKSNYGALDGNPLSLEHFQNLDSSITQAEIDELVQLEIFKSEEYCFILKQDNIQDLTKDEEILLSFTNNTEIIIDSLKSQKVFKLEKMSIKKIIESLKQKDIIECTEIRYDFKNTKISTGLFGVSRIFLPSSDIFPTLVASDTNDFITLKTIEALNHHDFKNKFIKGVYESREFRKITKREACLIQGFPEDFKLPGSRPRWMKLIGNSVSVPVIDKLCKAIVETGVFEN
ncbi:MAG: DNA (cytosine-5-)-methyltransferase [Nostocales cyanobacterium LacPavin_0920_SED1_MAG_38_18]|jgi:DNA (cytosine-5)-methyltransferase 1|uniref:Cytosine-specific methyltransferase n=1 Tax=Aphanizomenon flos-aquae FACHB-1040 TaxID=2692887 RepID=A0ABR8BZS2_APHFL|nr:DNA (cytosine-5-)-methyltransferase [Aphanizomenon flos-aquae]MBD2280292.1 DNA (cytosine-5-)-methyltransferase [Aphanizomenon flos-aquae FACHB-1040]MBO1068005.1 DNA (cytosine-5-)-methyltransferase [Dolichospermum sp. DEX189]MCX5983576.1 DNA (cytosine-5-)-methyltransferase [Nostocales cyanobacterium LacPavin_0920_SED1_MAG_38_18]